MLTMADVTVAPEKRVEDGSEGKDSKSGEKRLSEEAIQRLGDKSGMQPTPAKPGDLPPMEIIFPGTGAGIQNDHPEGAATGSGIGRAIKHILDEAKKWD